MSRIHVLVAATPPDLEADGIAAAVAGHASMILAGERVLALADVEACLASIPVGEPLALVLVGNDVEAKQLARRLLAARTDLVVVRVDIVDHLVQIAQYATRDRSLALGSLLAALCELASEAGARETLHAGPPRHPGDTPTAAARPLLEAAIDWIHAVLRNSAAHQAGGNGDMPGVTLTAATISELLDERPRHAAPAPTPGVQDADDALARALRGADARVERLAAAVSALALTDLEFRVLLLAMAPELDLRYQRCIGMLLDDLGRRVGSLALFMALLGEPSAVRCQLAQSGNLVRWRILENRVPGLPGADEAARLDPPLVAWLFGEAGALDTDPAVRRVLCPDAWPGASLYRQERDRQFARDQVGRLLAAPAAADPARFVLYSGECAAWCALLEVGAAAAGVAPVRADAARLAGLDPAAIDDTGVRLARLARLARRPLLVDTCAAESTPQADDALRLLLVALGGAGCRTGIVCTEPARIVRLLGALPFALADEAATGPATRLANVRAAAELLGLGAEDSALQMLVRQYPLDVAGFEHAMRLAQAGATDGADMERFVGACQYVAAEGISRMVECIEPAPELGDVILPPDRARQLDEIVDNVRLAAQVLDGWRIGEQVPFGRGVTALFHGVSGTGKTMAAIGIARRLKIRILRIDLSRIVSKYIGETEKNIDRIFLDAHRSGAAILIDEAEALLGKRSEVKDSHDRYANIEVAYLLQRMETYEGLVILTTNLRQNLDPAFLRRLRFVIDFPRPDADARERIWRSCLPSGAHALSDAAFHLLARKVDMTGGHIRQISLRAAFLAAAADSLITLAHIAQATNAELGKLGMAAIDLEPPGTRLAA
jgi:hypothetical protein